MGTHRVEVKARYPTLDQGMQRPYNRRMLLHDGEMKVSRRWERTCPCHRLPVKSRPDDVGGEREEPSGAAAPSMFSEQHRPHWHDI